MFMLLSIKLPSPPPYLTPQRIPFYATISAVPLGITGGAEKPLISTFPLIFTALGWLWKEITAVSQHSWPRSLHLPRYIQKYSFGFIKVMEIYESKSGGMWWRSKRDSLQEHCGFPGRRQYTPERRQHSPELDGRGSKRFRVHLRIYLLGIRL